MDVCERLNFGFVVNCNFLGIFYRVLKYILNVFRFDIRGYILYKISIFQIVLNIFFVVYFCLDY